MTQTVVIKPGFPKLTLSAKQPIKACGTAGFQALHDFSEINFTQLKQEVDVVRHDDPAKHFSGLPRVEPMQLPAHCTSRCMVFKPVFTLVSHYGYEIDAVPLRMPSFSKRAFSRPFAFLHGSNLPRGPGAACTKTMPVYEGHSSSRRSDVSRDHVCRDSRRTYGRTALFFYNFRYI